MSSSENPAVKAQETVVSNGPTGTTPRWLQYTISVVARIMITFHLISIWYPIFSPILYQNAHISFAFVIAFLAAVQQSNSRFRYLYLFGIILGLGATVFVHVEVDRLDMYAGFPEGADVVVGLILVALVVYLTFKIWGGIFPTLLGISVLYGLFGHLIPGALGHGHMAPDLILSNLGIGLTGIYGMMLNSSANLIFLFIIFGSVFEAVRIDKFFLEIGNFLGKHLRGGAAQTAVFSSSFVGMCTGAAAANVALTGSYTIPLMKKTGFKSEYAGAIEAVASTGGQLTPPVMGVAIFLMASFLGVGYGELMLKALIPAVFFYLFIFFGVIIIATREKIPMLTTKIDRTRVIRGAPSFVLPMGLVTVLLVMRYTPAYAAAVGLGVLLVVSLLQKQTRPTLSGLIAGFSKGAIMGAGIAVACACIGMFMVMLTTTGAGPKLAGMIQVLAGGNLVIALVLTMMLSILLGCAMPTPVAYVITALVVAPALVDMGLDMTTAHFFVFYFAILSAVTPPVAGASVVGSKLAETGYMVTGWESLKLVLPFFILPYFLARNQIILLQGQPFLDAAGAFTGLLLAGFGLMVFAQGFFLNRVRILERILFLVAVFLAAAYGQYGSGLALITALILTMVLVGRQIIMKRQTGVVNTVNTESTA